MLPAERLPAELWLIIFDLARGTRTGPQQYCNYITFPHLNLHLRRPSEHAFTIHEWPRNFRLISRYFNALLETPPSFFMIDANAEIPISTRALYTLPKRKPYVLLPKRKPYVCLDRLLADPSICSRITLLNLSGHEAPIHSFPTDFDFLCDSAHSLPGVRTLTLCVLTAPAIPRFWFRLNKVFPLLTTFRLQGNLVTTFPDTEVVFKHVEVMDWDHAAWHHSLRFPALRYASFGSISYYELRKQPLLESLLLRSLSRGARFEWSQFPNLRLLGLPAQRIDAFSSLPPANHPLQHLYVFVGTKSRDDHNQHLFGYEVELKWLKKTIEWMPNITRLTLWFDKRGQNRIWWISGDFHEEDLELLGFTQKHFPYTDYANGYHKVFQRVKAEPQAEDNTTGEPVPQRKGFHVGWNKFFQSASRRLHI